MNDIGQVLVLGLIAGGIYALFALGVVLVYRGTGALNFALGEIGTLAAYMSWKFTTDWGMPWVVGALAGITLAAVVGIAFERLVVRPMVDANRLSVAVGTVGLLLFLIAFEFKVFTGSPRAVQAPIAGLGVEVFGVFVSPTQVLALLVAASIGGALALFLKRTDFGLGVLAASQDAAATRLVGVPLARITAFVWGASAAVAAIAALLIIPTLGGDVTPGKVSRLFVFGLAAAIVGGLQSLPGAFAGGIIVGIWEAAAKRFLTDTGIFGVETVAVVALILVVLLLRPQGLLARTAARPA